MIDTNVLQAIECQHNQRNGFVTFKEQKNNLQHPIVPKHFLANLPQPSTVVDVQDEVQTKSSTDYLSEIDRLKQEMAKMQSDREEKLHELKKTRQKRSTPPPPPVVDFRKQR